MGKGDTFVLKMRKEIYNQSLNVKDFLLQYILLTHAHYQL